MKNSKKYQQETDDDERVFLVIFDSQLHQLEIQLLKSKPKRLTIASHHSLLSASHT
jgi:hypothetical protein